jgi:hypothetical protein
MPPKNGIVMSWQDATEITVGFVLHKRLSPDLVNPEDCYPPYHEIIPLMRDGADIPDVVAKVGYSSVRQAMEAAEHINGEMKPFEWVKVLTQSASTHLAADKLDDVVKKMRGGKDYDIGVALKAISLMEDGHRELTPMSEILPEENSWILTGWEPVDSYIGGLIKAGLITIGASPGVGKTTLVLKLATSMVKKYKKKKVAIFTLEMTTGQITQRALEVAKITKEEKERILLGDSSFSINDIYATAARYASHEDLSMIAVDFADLLIEGEASESVMGNIYKTLSLLAKKTGVPVVLISQLHRNTYTGGTPKVNHLRYSGMAEAMSALILLIYNPHNILVDTGGGKSELETIEGKGYLIEGKSRFGYKKGGPGAVMIEWDGLGGWGDKGLGWFKIAS